jgi:hypothetical protein
LSWQPWFIFCMRWAWVNNRPLFPPCPVPTTA